MKNWPGPKIDLLNLPCWFCGQIGGDMAWSWEFDTPVHMECIRAALAHRDDQEIMIFAREFDLSSEPPDDFTPDTGTPMTFVELAGEMDRLGTPCGEDEELSVDVDDYPLF